MSKRSKARRQDLIRSMEGLKVLQPSERSKSLTKPAKWWNKVWVGMTCGILAGVVVIWLM